MPLSTRLNFKKDPKVKANSVAYEQKKEFCIELDLDSKTNLNHCCKNLVHRELGVDLRWAKVIQEPSLQEPINCCIDVPKLNSVALSK